MNLSAEVKPNSLKFSINAQNFFLIIWAFYSFTSVLLGSELSFMYELSSIKKVFDYTTLVLLVLLFFLKRTYQLKAFISYCIFIFLVFLIELTITNRSFLIYIMFIIVAQDFDIGQIIRFDFKLRIITFCTIVGLCLLGFLDNYTSLFYGTTLKSAYGFGHPNTFTIYAIIILLEWMLIRYKKMRISEWILNFILFYFAYSIGGGRTASYAYIAIYFLFVIARLFPAIYKTTLSYFMFIIITPLMAIFSFVGAYLYGHGNEFFITLNYMMTSRFSCMWSFFNKYDITLFGQVLETMGSRQARLLEVSSAILDNAYAQCLLKYGIFFFIFFIFSYIYLFIFFLKKDQFGFALFALFFVVIGIAEGYMLQPTYNLTLLCFLGIQNLASDPAHSLKAKIGKRSVLTS